MNDDPRLEDLVAAIRACRICRETPAGRPLPHEPRPVIQASATARICISGQAPGTKVHASGRPFDDRSGQRLRDWMAVTEEEFYDETRIATVPMGFCFPGQDAAGGDLPPRRECSAHWHEAVFAALHQVELVLAIGQYAQAFHLGTDRRRSLGETVLAWHEIWDRSVRPRVLPLPHPSWRNTGWLKKNPWFEQDLVPLLRAEVRRLL